MQYDAFESLVVVITTKRAFNQHSKNLLDIPFDFGIAGRCLVFISVVPSLNAEDLFSIHIPADFGFWFGTNSSAGDVEHGTFGYVDSRLR